MLGFKLDIGEFLYDLNIARNPGGHNPHRHDFPD
jgi:hypothetical protein